MIRPPRKTVDQLLDEARARLDRLEPAAAYEASLAGARMIDIRSERQLARDGMIPDALIIPRNVFEWRLDPSGAYRHPYAPGSEDWTIVVCDGVTSRAWPPRPSRTWGWRTPPI